MSEQAIPDDIMETAKAVAYDLNVGRFDEPTEGSDAILDRYRELVAQGWGFTQSKRTSEAEAIARAIIAERQKHNRPASPDLQAEAERVFADVQRAVLVEDVKQVIAKALQAATDAERDRWMAYQISETDRLLNRVR